MDRQNTSFHRMELKKDVIFKKKKIKENLSSLEWLPQYSVKNSEDQQAIA